MLSLFHSFFFLKACYGSFNLTKYKYWLEEFDKHADVSPVILERANTWYRENTNYSKETLWRWGEVRSKLDYTISEVAKSCLIPYDGVPIWDIPRHIANSRKCRDELLKNKTKQTLLAAMEPVGEYPPITGFFHISLNVTSYLIYDRHDAIFETQIQKLQKSKLLDHAKLVVHIGLIDEHLNHTNTICVRHLVETRIQTFAKNVKIQYVNPFDYECGTLRYLQNWCNNNENSLVFYLHNKGVTHLRKGAINFAVRDWREYMMFFLFERWRLCANSLTHGAAACGVDQKRVNGNYLHYSGNFWWARCDHVVRIRNNICWLGKGFRHAAEFWLISNETLLKESRAVELWTGDAGYTHAYPRSNYDCIDLLQLNETKENFSS